MNTEEVKKYFEEWLYSLPLYDSIEVAIADGLNAGDAYINGRGKQVYVILACDTCPSPTPPIGKENSIIQAYLFSLPQYINITEAIEHVSVGEFCLITGTPAPIYEGRVTKIIHL